MCVPATRPGWFSATDDPAARQFYTLDPAAIGAALGLPRVAPFILVALGPAAAGALPGSGAASAATAEQPSVLCDHLVWPGGRPRGDLRSLGQEGADA